MKYRSLLFAVSSCLAFAASCASDEAPVDNAAPLVTPQGKSVISGRIVFSGAKAVSRAAVSLVGPITRGILTGEDGAFRFESIPEGVYTVTATVASTEEKSLTNSVLVDGINEATPFDLGFTPLGTVRGRVTLAGAPTGNAGIFVLAIGGSQIVATDDAGNYALSARAGSQRVQAVRAGYDAPPVSVEVTYAESTTAPNIDLQSGAAATGSVTGRASVLGDADASGIEVTVEGTSTRATTAADGTYVLAGVGAGVRALVFKKAPFEQRVPQVLLLPGSSAFAIADGKLVELAKVELQRGRHVVSDKVDTAELGQPTSRTGLSFRKLDGTTYFVNETGAYAVGATRAHGWAPDGARAYFAGVEGLKRIDMTNGASAVLDATAYSAPDPGSISVSPNGARVSYSKTASSVGFVAAAGGLPVVAGGAPWPISFSTDGARAAFSGAGSILSAVQTTTGILTPLGTTAGAFAMRADGQIVIYYDGGNLASVPASGGIVTTLNTNVTQALRVEAAYLLRKSDNTCLMIKDDGTPVGLGAPCTAVAPANGTNAVVVYRNVNNHFAFVVATGASIPLGNAAGVDVNLAGDTIVYLKNGTELRAVGTNGMGDRLIDAAAGPAFISPDGTKVAYLSVGDQVLRVVTANAGAPTTLGPAADCFGWSSDGQRIVYAAPGIDRVLTSIAAGGGPSTALVRDAVYATRAGAKFIVTRGSLTGPEFFQGVYLVTP